MMPGANYNMKKFTIIIPVKNGGSYFKACVQSVLSQTMEQYHLHILAHDCTDDTLDWLDGLSDKRIVVDYKENVDGILGNWQRIQSIPKNEFMTILGYDDLLLPHYLETMNRLIEQHPDASLYQAHFNYINSAGEKVRKCQPMPEVIPVEDFLQREFEQTLDSMGTGYMMRSADYDRLGGIPMHYPNLIFADYELWVRLTGLSYLAVSHETLFEYRLHNSVSKVTNGEDYAKAYFNYLEFLNAFKKENPKAAIALRNSGGKFMMDFCQSLAHRILKTPVQNRKITVAAFVKKCEDYAQQILPSSEFSPLNKKGISLAILFDKNNFTRGLFRFALKVRNSFS